MRDESHRMSNCCPKLYRVENPCYFLPSDIFPFPLSVSLTQTPLADVFFVENRFGMALSRLKPPVVVWGHATVAWGTIGDWVSGLDASGFTR